MVRQADAAQPQPASSPPNATALLHTFFLDALASKYSLPAYNAKRAFGCAWLAGSDSTQLPPILRLGAQSKTLKSLSSRSPQQIGEYCGTNDRHPGWRVVCRDKRKIHGKREKVGFE